MNMNSTNQKTTSARANFRPILHFIALAYGWTWLWWLPSHLLFDLPQAWKTPLTLVGGFGPALAGVLIVRKNTVVETDRPLNPWGFIIGFLLALAAIALFWFEPMQFRDPDGPLYMPKDSPWATFIYYGLAAVLSGFVIDSVVSRRSAVREVFAGIIPDRKALILLLPVILFLPALLITSNILAGWLGFEVQTSRFQQEVANWMPVMLLNIFTVAMMTGGNEEYGWRGVLQPMMQRQMSPLTATLVIAVVWELWHLPLVVSGFYGDGPVAGILILRLFIAFLFSVWLTVIYNYSRGSIFLCVIFHACINVQIGLFVGTQFSYVLAILIVISLIAGMRMWRRDRGFVPAVMKSEP